MTKIVIAPNSVLSQKAKNYVFKKNDAFLPKILKEMEEALLSAHDPKGVGLAAPQIGKSISIFISKPNEKSKIQVYINPVIIEKFEQTNQKPSKPAGRKKTKKPVKLEGCLSLPDIWGEVKRFPSVRITYQNEKGEKLEKSFEEFEAVIVQHEIDHLNGILFPKRVLEQKGKLYHSSKNEKGEDEFEEISI